MRTHQYQQSLNGFCIKKQDLSSDLGPFSSAKEGREYGQASKATRLPTQQYWGGILLVSGTCIGAGMLGLPVSSAPAGFASAILLLVLCWLVMLFSGWLFMEVSLCLPEGTSFISMAEITLGFPGKVLTGFSYLLLLYSLVAAYFTGGGSMTQDAVQKILSICLPQGGGSLPWLFVIGALLLLGMRSVDTFNRFLVAGLFAALLVLIVFMLPHVSLARLRPFHPQAIFSALPIVIISFGYHVVIPSVRTYVRSNSTDLRRAIFWGSLIPLLIYALWELDIFGIIPIDGALGLNNLLRSGDPTVALSASIFTLLQNYWILYAMQAVVFFALSSSFLGVALSLFDFISDGLPRVPHGLGRFLRALLTLLPPALYAFLYPQGFMLALHYAGIFVAVLNILLPALMVWNARRSGLIPANGYRTPGGKAMLLAISLFAILVIVTDLYYA